MSFIWLLFLVPYFTYFQSSFLTGAFKAPNFTFAWLLFPPSAAPAGLTFDMHTESSSYTRRLRPPARPPPLLPPKLSRQLPSGSSASTAARVSHFPTDADPQVRTSFQAWETFWDSLCLLNNRYKNHYIYRCPWGWGACRPLEPWGSSPGGGGS